MAKLLGQFSPAGYLHRFGPVGYREVKDPTLFADDWVMVKTRYCGICGSDLKEIFLEGAIDNPLTSFISFPHVMGHEIAGTVEEVGRGVKGLQRGDRVIVNPWLSCEPRGLAPCRACQAGQGRFCESFTSGPVGTGMHLGTASNAHGGFAPYISAHQSMCYRIPDEVPFEVAALADPFSVSFHAVHKAPPQPGQKVLVFGCGALGASVIHTVARLYPGVHVIAVDVEPAMREVALSFGAHEFLSLTGGALIEAIGEKSQAKLFRPMSGLPWLMGGVDTIYDTVGSARTLETGVRLCKALGTIVVVGVSTPQRFEWTPLYFKELNLVGSNGCGLELYAGQTEHAFSHYLKLCAKGRIEPGRMVTHTIALSDYRRGFLVAHGKKQHRSLKVLLAP